MPDYTKVQERRGDIEKALSVILLMRQVYSTAKAAQEVLTLYQSGTDPSFNEVVDYFYNTTEKQKLSAMLSNLQTLIDAWDASYSDMLDGSYDIVQSTP